MRMLVGAARGYRLPYGMQLVVHDTASTANKARVMDYRMSN